MLFLLIFCRFAELLCRLTFYFFLNNSHFNFKIEYLTLISIIPIFSILGLPLSIQPNDKLIFYCDIVMMAVHLFVLPSLSYCFSSPIFFFAITNFPTTKYTDALDYSLLQIQDNP